MSPRDWLSVGARLFGLWIFYRGYADLLSCGALVLKLTPGGSIEREFGDSVAAASNYYLWYSAGYLALAFYLLFGAEHLTRLLFNEQKPTDESTD